MTRPDTQTLYVMQNEVGLIKIGRSLDPERRRRTLQSDEQCAVSLIAILTGQGHREEAIHLSLSDHLVEGEWFEGTAEAQAEISALLPELGRVDWPFLYDADEAGVWLDGFFARRDRRSLRKQFYRMLNVHVRGSSPGYGTDAMISIMISLIGRDGLNAEPTTAVVRAGRTPGQPNYSSDLQAALAVWPEDCRPSIWEGSAHDCAIAALDELYRRLPA